MENTTRYIDKENPKNKRKHELSTIRYFDLLFSEKEKEMMLEKLQIKFGKTKEELLIIIATP